MERSCETCGKPAKKWCAKCKVVWYCSRDCQSSHWKSSHKSICKEPPETTNVDVPNNNSDEQEETKNIPNDSDAQEETKNIPNDSDAQEETKNNSDALEKSKNVPKPEEDDQLTFEETKIRMHKVAFDNVFEKYNHLKSDENASAIADFLLKNSGKPVSREEFADRFGMTEDEAGIVLSWIERGIKFKEQYLKPPDKCV